MRIVSLAVVFLLTFIFQASVAARLSIGPARLDCPFLLLAFYSMARGPVPGTVMGFLVGFVQDLFNPTLMGLNSLCKSIVGYGMGRFAARMTVEAEVLLFPLVLGAGLVHDLIYLMFFHRLALGAVFRDLLLSSLPSFLYTALAAVIIYRLYRYLSGKVVRINGKAESP